MAIEPCVSRHLGLTVVRPPLDGLRYLIQSDCDDSAVPDESLAQPAHTFPGNREGTSRPQSVYLAAVLVDMGPPSAQNQSKTAQSPCGQLVYSPRGSPSICS